MTLPVQQQPESAGHIPIMVREIIDLLSPSSGQTYVDLTIGRGGHAAAFAPILQKTGTIVGFDVDPENLQYTRNRLQNINLDENHQPAVILHHANFIQAPGILAENNIKANCLLADLGFSSNQMDDPIRGFSFRESGPLDMRLDPRSTLTAAQIVNHADEREIADLIYQLGEEPYSRRIAKRIVEERANHPIENTKELAEIVVKAYGPRARRSRNHPATRTFMALRIAVNRELDHLRELVRQMTTPKIAENWLNPDARIALLTFHSLEDRIVKQMIRGLSDDGRAKRITRKPITASQEEIRMNPRSRSAKLRIFQMIKNNTQ